MIAEQEAGIADLAPAIAKRLLTAAARAPTPGRRRAAHPGTTRQREHRPRAPAQLVEVGAGRAPRDHVVDLAVDANANESLRAQLDEQLDVAFVLAPRVEVIGDAGPREAVEDTVDDHRRERLRGAERQQGLILGEAAVALVVVDADPDERDVRKALNIPFNPGAAATRYEHSMGQFGRLPSTILRQSTAHTLEQAHSDVRNRWIPLAER